MKEPQRGGGREEEKLQFHHHRHHHLESSGGQTAGSKWNDPGSLASESKPRGTVHVSPPPIAHRMHIGRQASPPPTERNSAAAENVNPEVIKRKLENVLGDKHKFMKSAKASFKQFDSDNSNSLSRVECRNLMHRLIVNLQLPPCDDETLLEIYERFNTQEGEQMNCNDFCMMFHFLLSRIRQNYYPDKDLQVGRSFFIGRQALGEDQIRRLFQFEKRLGGGSFGEAHLVIEKSSGLRRCCKIINKEKATVPTEQIAAEVAVLKKLDHPNVIRIYEVYEDFHNLYIVQELCEGGEVLRRVTEAAERGKLLTEKYVRELIYQLINALAYIHDQHVVHKDLKPENILFQDEDLHSDIKVIDFGLSEMFKRDDDCSQNAAGTVLYMAPEVFARRITTKCDLWSAGCVMYLLLTGVLPFQGRNIAEVKNKILRGEPQYEISCRHLSEEAMSLMSALLRKNPRLRPSAKECFEYPWLQDAHGTEVFLDKSMNANLQNYTKYSGLKAAVINMMTHQLNCNGSQIKNLARIFIQLDTDHSGTLSGAELSEGLTKAGFRPRSGSDVNKLVQALDVAGSGLISYTEFLAAAYTWREMDLNVVKTAFNKLDHDGDGNISIEQFVEMLNTDVNARCTHRDDVLKELKSMDTDQDGLISWHEFLNYLRN